MNDTDFYENMNFNVPEDLAQVTDDDIIEYYFLVWGVYP